IGDGGSDDVNLTINGTLPGGGILRYSDIFHDDYDEDDAGDDTEAASGEAESDTLTSNDKGTVNETYYYKSAPFIDPADGALTIIIDDNTGNDSFGDHGDDSGSFTSGADDFKLTADDLGQANATRTTTKWGSAGNQSWSSTVIVSTWGTDKDHTYSDTISLNGVETGETDNGWWDDVGGRRVDTWVNTTGPGSDTNATYDYNIQTHNNRKEWTDDEVTYFRHDTHDYGHGEGNGSFTNPLDGVAYLTRNY